VWGGEHVRLTVSEAGGSIEFDCAHGTLDAPLKVDTEGRWSVPGTLVREGGPAREGQEEEVQSVRYAGRTDGRRLDLELFGASGESLGAFKLELGARSRLFKCR
jgi:hypothetical protein